MPQIEKPKVPMYRLHGDERYSMEWNQPSVFTIYHSVAKKVEKRMYRQHKLLLGVPWNEFRRGPYFRRLRGIYGFNILKVVVESVFAARGFPVEVSAADGNYLHSGEHINLNIRFSDPDIATMTKTVELPVTDTAVWHPRRFGVGCWSFIETHKGDCYRITRHVVDAVNRQINHHLPGHRLSKLYGCAGLWINPTDHVRRITGIIKTQRKEEV